MSASLSVALTLSPCPWNDCLLPLSGTSGLSGFPPHLPVSSTVSFSPCRSHRHASYFFTKTLGSYIPPAVAALLRGPSWESVHSPLSGSFQPILVGSGPFLCRKCSSMVGRNAAAHTKQSSLCPCWTWLLSSTGHRTTPSSAWLPWLGHIGFPGFSVALCPLLLGL